MKVSNRMTKILNTYCKGEPIDGTCAQQGQPGEGRFTGVGQEGERVPV